MSDCMIIRRGGGGQGFDPNGAVLKVVTSTGCTVAVTNSSAGYSKTHQQADGYPRSNDENVTEHFFSIPASAFGTITVKATNTYGDNTKMPIVNTAGKVYEVLIAAPNIILNSTFGLQEGLSLGPGVTYSEVNKELTLSSLGPTVKDKIFQNIFAISAFETIEVTADVYSSSGYFKIIDQDSRVLSEIYFNQTYYEQDSDTITNVFYPEAYLYHQGGLRHISEIVLS